jgi:hypothetical protein
LSDAQLAKIFSHSVGGGVSWIKRPYLLLYKSFLIPCSPFCPSFLLVAGLLEFYWGSSCLYLLLPEYSLLFLVLTARFQVWY